MVQVPLQEEVASVDQLINYIQENKGCVIKDRSGYDGFNVFVIRCIDRRMTYKGNEIGKKALEEILSKVGDGLIQQLVFQGDFENRLFPDSVNTVRMISVRKEDELQHEIIAAVQRIGTKNSAPVDNFNQGGLSSLIDVETGILGKAAGIKATDKDGHKLFFEKHPDTGAQIEGLAIPRWMELKNCIIDATRKLPFFDYIAWDIALQNDGFTVIETNMKSSLNLFQVHGGLRHTLFGGKYRECGYLVDDAFFQ